MNDKKEEPDTNDSLQHYLSALARPAAELSKPSIERLGIAFGSLVEAGLHLVRIDKVLEYNAKKNIILAENIKQLSLKLDKSEKNQIKEIPLEIAHPIVEQFSITSNMELRAAYVNLAAKAASTEYAHLAHPSFTYIIRSLSPDEILLLSNLKIEINKLLELQKTEQFDSLAFAIIEYGLKQSLAGSEARWTWASNYSFLNSTNGMLFPENVEFYMENLISLGILKTNFDGQISEDTDSGKYSAKPSSIYSRLDKMAKNNVQDKAVNDWGYYSLHGILRPTDKGLKFLDAISDDGT